MRTLLLSLMLTLAGCASSTAATTLAEQAPNFRAYSNPDRFCADAGLGYYAIGYQEVNPWTARLFCLNEKGIHEATAAENGGGSDIRTRYDTKSSGEIVWIGRANDHGHVSLADGLIDGCPDKSEPLAVIPVEADETYYGAFVRSGHRLCVVNDTLVLLDGRNPAADALHTWEGFTPIP